MSVKVPYNYELIKQALDLNQRVHNFEINTTTLFDDQRRKLEAGNDDKHRELTDILRAVALSNLMTNKNTLEELETSISIFKKAYFGFTQIFSREIDR